MRLVNPDRRCQDRVGNAVGVDLHALDAERQTFSASRKSGLVSLSTKPHLTFGFLPERQLPKFAYELISNFMYIVTLLSIQRKKIKALHKNKSKFQRPWLDIVKLSC